MNRLAVIVVMLALAVPVHAQFTQNFASRDVLLHNTGATLPNRAPFLIRDNVMPGQFRMPGERMKKTGATLTVVGTAMLIGGIVLASNGGTEIDPYTGYEVADGKTVLGALMIVGGTGMVIPGIIFWSKGSKKYNQYLREQNLSLSLHNRSAGIAFRF